MPCRFYKSRMQFSIWAIMLCTVPSRYQDSGKTFLLACSSLFQEWRDRFAEYTSPAGVPGYIGYNRWGIDAAADIVEHLPGCNFLMLVNVGAVDSAGQNLGHRRISGRLLKPWMRR